MKLRVNDYGKIIKHKMIWYLSVEVDNKIIGKEKNKNK